MSGCFADDVLAKLIAFRRDKAAPILPAGYEETIAIKAKVSNNDMTQRKNVIVDLECLQQLIPDVCPNCNEPIKVKYLVSYHLVIVFCLEQQIRD